MITYIEKRHNSLPYRILSAFIAFTFIISVVLPPSAAAQVVLNLPAPGTMVVPGPVFTPTLIKGLTIHPENPLEFDFIVEKGLTPLQGEEFNKESMRLVKYFLASLTVPEDQMWVNLSPHEKDRIISENLGATDMGRDMLAQDYILKQLTASLMYPENELGRKFWDRIYKKAREQYGTAEIPVDTFNKVWIMPDRAVVYEHAGSVFVIDSHLKVMLEEDYVAMQHETKDQRLKTKDFQSDEGKSSVISLQSSVPSVIIKEIILPEIEKEVNTGETFANLRQIYHSMILATWYKKNLRESLLGQVYVDKSKTRGVDLKDPEVNQKIYEQYLEAFKKGVYNYIKEDVDPLTQEIIPRKYFSGGAVGLKESNLTTLYRLPQKQQTEIITAFREIGNSPDARFRSLKIKLYEIAETNNVPEETMTEIVRGIESTTADEAQELFVGPASSSPVEMLSLEVLGEMLRMVRGGGLEQITNNKLSVGSGDLFLYTGKTGEPATTRAKEIANDLVAHLLPTSVKVKRSVKKQKVFFVIQNGLVYRRAIYHMLELKINRASNQLKPFILSHMIDTVEIPARKVVPLESHEFIVWSGMSWQQAFIAIKIAEEAGIKDARLERKNQKVYVIVQGQDRAFVENRLKEKAGLKPASSPVEARRRAAQIRSLLPEIEKELANPGTGNLPEVAVMSDFHGGLNRFIMILSDVLNNLAGFQGQIDPNRTIEEQLAAQGLSFQDIKGQIILGGDILDRGKHGIKIFLLIKELVEKGEGKVLSVTGNHDFWAFANLLGLHIPWYKGFQFYGDTEAENLIAKYRQTNPELFDSPESVVWWTERLAEHNADQDAYQKKAFDGKVKEVRARFIEDYKTYQNNWTDPQKDAIEKFIGYFARIGVTDPYVGLNGLGKTSALWWKQVLKQINQGYEARRSLGAEDAELSVWQEAIALAEKISRDVDERLDQALNDGKWWYRIFESINTHAYRSVEWSAKDWSSHKGWGDSVIAEINEMIDAGLIHEEKLTQKNYIQNPTLQALARFYRDNFNLYALTPYGDLFSHGGFPVNPDGTINIFYKSVTYKGADIFSGLSAVSNDVKDQEKSLQEIWEALHLVNTWYADMTTELKPNYIKRNIEQIGIPKINQGIGVRHHVTGHNPIALGKLAGRPFMAGDSGYTHAFADFGMSEKYGGQGGWVSMGAAGIKLRGFESETSDTLVDNPRTHVWDKETGQIKKTIKNPGLEGDMFLSGAKEQLSEELARLVASSPIWTNAELKNTLDFLNRQIGSVRTDSELDRKHERQIYYSSAWSIMLSYDSFASHQTRVALVDSRGHDRYAMRYSGSLALAKDEQDIRQDLEREIKKEIAERFSSSPVVEGEEVDFEGIVFMGNVLIENRSGQRVELAKMSGEFFPRTPDGRPIIEDTHILIVRGGDAAAVTSSPVTQRGGFAKNLVFAVGLGILSCVNGCGPGPKTTPPEIVDTTLPISVKNVFNWMRNQQNSHTGLVESFDNTTDLILKGQTSTYDQALAVITNIQGGDIQSARKIMNFFVKNWNRTHGFVNFYTTSKGQPGIQKAIAKHKGSRVHSGPNLWIGIAAVALYEATGDIRYLNLAIEIATWAAEIVPHDANGGIAMGPQDDVVFWTKVYSTEHNLDYAAVLQKLLAKQANLTTTKRTLFESELTNVKRWLKDRYNPQTGILDRGLWDATKSLDATTFFILTFGPQVIQDEFGIDPDRLISKVEEYFGTMVVIPGIQGAISGFDFTKATPDFRGPVIWFEGTGQMTAVYEVMAKWHETLGNNEMADNDRAKKDFYTAQIDKVKRIYSDGREAVPYASKRAKTFPDGWYTPSNGPDGNLAVSVSGSSWRIISDVMYNPMMVNEKTASSPVEVAVNLDGGARLQTSLDDRFLNKLLSQLDTRRKHYQLAQDYKIIKTEDDQLKLVDAERWTMTKTPLSDVDDTLGILDRIKELDTLRKKEGEPRRLIRVLDWGAGEGVALIALKKWLNEAAISDVELIGYSDIYYPGWHNAPEGITFIFDVVGNLIERLSGRKIDLIYSRFGMYHYTSEAFDREEVVQHFRDLNGTLSPSGEIRSDFFYLLDSEVAASGFHIMPIMGKMGAKMYPIKHHVDESEFTKDDGRAMKDEVGGINLDPRLLDLQIKRDGNGVPLPLPMQPIENMHIDGFLPIIINVTPVTNLPLILGIADNDSPSNSADSGSQLMELGFAVKEN